MSKRVVLLMVVSAVVGATLVPPVVDAATQLVTIKGAGNNNKAKVTGGGRLRMDTEAATTIPGSLDTTAFTVPGVGMIPFATGTASTAVPADAAILTHITVDLPSGNGPATVTLTDDFGLVWKGTVEEGSRHLDAAFETGSLWGPGGLQVDVEGTGAEWVVAGVPIDLAGNPSSRREAAKAAMKALRQQR
jgi:hypothetical protein